MQHKYSKFDITREETHTLLDSLTTCCVILAFYKGTIKVLLTKTEISDKWMLPGGFVRKDENVDDAAHNVLKAFTGLDNIYMQQFHLFGKHSRHNPAENNEILSKLNIEFDDNHWAMKRFVAIGYYALVKYDRVQIIDGSVNQNCAWFDLDNITELYCDHNEVIHKSIKFIKREIGYIPLGYELLSEKFIMPDLRIIYETFIGHELDRRNFQRKMLSIGLLIKLDEKMKKGAHKSPYFYSFNEDVYKKVLKENGQLMPWSMQ